MTPDQRRAIVIANEGNALSSAGHHGPEGAAEFTRLTIDGLMNALVRLEGAESAAAYSFALGDRVAGGLREPTDWRSPIAPVAPATKAEDAQAETLRVLVLRSIRTFPWHIYVLGLLHGAIALALSLSWRSP